MLKREVIEVSISVLKHDSRLDRIPFYFTEKYSGKETPQQYIQRLLASPSPWCGYDKTPTFVAQEIWRLTIRMVNQKYRTIRQEEQAYHYETRQIGRYILKSGRHKGTAIPVIEGQYIWVFERPVWIDNATGNIVPFNLRRYQAGEIRGALPRMGGWYSLERKRFASFVEVKSLAP
jgi:hypothetical protein